MRFKAEGNGSRLTAAVAGEQAADRIWAGAKPERRFDLATGAPIPRHADAVLMQEDAELRDGAILVRESVTRGENIRCEAVIFVKVKKWCRAGSSQDRSLPQSARRERIAGLPASASPFLRPVANCGRKAIRLVPGKFTKQTGSCSPIFAAGSDLTDLRYCARHGGSSS
jgi:hypothetical protein